MKVQCDVCERAEATMLCCADEVHAANKLAGKHQRVALLAQSSSHSPNCDICQERVGYFFCLEDRALLCRHCDVAVHVASPHSSSHQRFLITGVRVALQPSPAGGGSGDRSGGATSNGSMASDSPASNSSPEKKRFRAAAAAAAEPPLGLPPEVAAEGGVDPSARGPSSSPPATSISTATASPRSRVPPWPTAID
ncbi:unnamed protein product [Spirodela intermedia]|uniref:B box-type domain-containing protein n=1 Tax=Spirodela intermedia TaxID=51605 RepID=A0A7I8J0Z8_SPIIN|nr:unnamed protein product [Spirodela intermedia]CAA6663904.1 unnamed protein product [Spirodela intermedia]